ncbi:MAG: hypothetical protein B6U89_05980 [Desulfurococcales archaeon ex4484_58]|nr:MAG: hypothetical protein B6U89_05980 [Desulfurococcales archaeon ex4484_58]
MKSFLHIVTVGTSIVRNASINVDKYDILSKHRDRLIRWARAPMNSYEDKEAGEHARESSKIFLNVYSYVVSDPYGSSAELNSLLKYLELLSSRGLKNIEHDIVLYPTDTGVSRFCAKIIKYFLEKDFIPETIDIAKEHRIGNVELVEVKGFGYDFWRGLLNLVSSIALKLRDNISKYDRILVNLTAGFKPETGFLLLVSSLLGIDLAYYIHEYMREVIEIPILELKLTATMKTIFTYLVKEQRIPSELIKITDRLGLTINGKPIPEAKEFAQIILKSTVI